MIAKHNGITKNPDIAELKDAFRDFRLAASILVEGSRDAVDVLESMKDILRDRFGFETKIVRWPETGNYANSAGLCAVQPPGTFCKPGETINVSDIGIKPGKVFLGVVREFAYGGAINLSSIRAHVCETAMPTNCSGRTLADPILQVFNTTLSNTTFSAKG